MIDVIAVAESGELACARRLRDLCALAWPDVAKSPHDRVSFVVGLRTLREIDVLVVIDLAAPRPLEAVRRRDGGLSAPASIQCAVIVVEVKELDASRLVFRGSQVFSVYHGRTSTRSVDAQVAQCAQAVRDVADRYGTERLFVHGIGWLPAVSERELTTANGSIVGTEATWPAMIDAAAWAGGPLYGEKSPAERRAVTTVRAVLVRSREFTPRDRRRADALVREAVTDDVLDDLATAAGQKMVRLTGRGGSGKTTTLALLARRLASERDARVLILTYHRALCGDIGHLVDGIVDAPNVRGRIVVETAVAYFLGVLTELDVRIPSGPKGIAFDELDATLAGAVARLAEGDAAYLREVDPTRFDYDHVLIDEGQDWSDAERDVICALYGPERIVVADGMEQLVRRQTPCAWTEGLPRSRRFARHLGRSLRMTRNVAAFANAFARAAGLDEWRIAPFDALPGGRIVVAVGGDLPTGGTARALGIELRASGATPIDALWCVPPSDVARAGDVRSSRLAAELAASGENVWDAVDPRNRDLPPADGTTWRVVQYDSCRGLEGWATVLTRLDQFVALRTRHPNLAPGETDEPARVVRRLLMIVLTRAVQILVITIADPEAPVLTTLREAAAALPRGVVEWTTGTELPAALASSAGP